MINLELNTKYRIDYTSKFKKQIKRVLKQGKNLDDLLEIITLLANKEELDANKLINNKIYKDCMECHIEPDWLLVYKYIDDKLVLLLIQLVVIVRF